MPSITRSRTRRRAIHDTGLVNLGVAEEGVGVAMDDNNKDLVTPEMTAAVDEAKQKIASGDIDVHDYDDRQQLPVLIA